MYSGFSPIYSIYNQPPYTATGGELSIPLLALSESLVFKNGLLMTLGYEYGLTRDGKIYLLNAASAGEVYSVVELINSVVESTPLTFSRLSIRGNQKAGYPLEARLENGDTVTGFQWYRNGIAIPGATSLYSRNFLLQSESFSTSPWVNSGATLTAAYGVNPVDDQTTTSRIQLASGSNSISQTVQFQDVAIGDIFNVSIYTKSATQILSFDTGTMIGATISRSYVSEKDPNWYRHDLRKIAGVSGVQNLVIKIAGPLDTEIFGAQLVRCSDPIEYEKTTTAKAPGNKSVYFVTAADENQIISVSTTQGSLTSTGV